jgi:23S rRNA (uracil1939-C5)-methyltransferase
MRKSKEHMLETEITGLAFGGRGIARMDGMAVFVEQTAPGDRVLIRITRRKKNFAEARLVEILEPSAERVTAPCRYSGFCGGCTWQFLRYAKQLEYKQRHVAESLEHIAGIRGVPVHATLASPSEFGYRNKMEFTCADRRWLLPAEMEDASQDRSFALGLHVPGTFHKVIDTQECLLQPGLGNQILAEIRGHLKASDKPVYGLKSHSGFWRFAVLRSSAATGRWMVNLVTAADDPAALNSLAQRLLGLFPEIASIVNNVTARPAGIAVGEFERLIAGESRLRDRIGRFEFDISANSFFQTNTAGAARLYETVRRYAALNGDETVIDLYSGTGTIPIFLAEHCREVVGIEIVASSVADAERNCRLNRVSNCRFIREDIRTGLRAVKERPDVMIIDPPRVGMAAEVLAQVLCLAPERIVYVSCHPATLARDLATLKEAYHVLEVQPVDMFPHTFHVESVAQMIRK